MLPCMPSPDSSTARSLREMTEPVVLVAFGGWSDAGGSATDALEHIQDISHADLVWDMGGEYYDLQATRPVIVGTEASREIIWPSTTVRTGRITDSVGRDLDLVLIQGPEPNMRWEMFCSQLVFTLRSVHPPLVLVLGAMLSDQHHSLPVPISRTSSSTHIRERFGATGQTYEGPTGITGVFTHSCERIGMDTMSLWATLPHYVANSPSPKATLALLQHIEMILDADLDLTELEQQARRWETDVTELVESDAELSEYVASLLEDHQDQVPNGSGDAIAAEFERYLRRRGT